MTMKTQLLCWLLLGALTLTACGPAPPPPRETVTVVNTDEAPTAIDEPVGPPPAIAPPAANQTLYLIHVRNAAGQVIKGARAMLLTEAPDALYMREPRKKTRIMYRYTPPYGRVEFMTEADGKPKFLVLGGDGFLPSLIQLDPATGGHTQEITVITEIMPIATVIVEDVNGNRVARPMVTMRPPTGTPSKYSVRGLKPNEGMTEIGDDLGEVKLTRPAGKYWLISSKGTADQGTCRKYQIIDWDGGAEPMVVRLPAKSEPKPEWYTFK